MRGESSSLPPPACSQELVLIFTSAPQAPEADQMWLSSELKPLVLGDV